MEYIIYCILGVLLLFFIILFFKQQKQNKYLLEKNKKIEENKLEELNQKYNERKEFLEEDYNKKQEYLQDQYKKRENQLYQDFYQAQQNYNKITENLNQNFKRYKESQYKSIQEDLEEYSKNEKFKKQIEIEKNTQELYEQYIKKQKLLEEEFQSKKAEIESEIEETYDDAAEAALEYCDILETLDDYKKRRDIINEINRREEELQNEIDTHRIILSNNSKDDIKYLLSIESNIHNKDLLHKLIWSEYLQKPFNIMLNNIFGSKIPKNVIYCIENYSTHKKYIGKTSAEVSKRWTEHIKTSLNIGGIKRQKIHDAIFQNWDEFTFSIIEIVDENKNLSEREKYWIGFYSTDKYGYNIKSGG